ncbi:MAG: polysaccharide deacetylase family protein [Elusimicrobiota bacterium]
MLNALGSAAMALAARFKDGGLIVNEHTLTREQTRVHVDALGRWVDFIHLHDLPDRLARRQGKPFCLLTFDDGKRSNATETAPELERLGVPACFPVVTDFLDGRTPLWFDLHALLLRKLGAPPPGLSPQAVKQLPLHLTVERIERACRRHGVSANLDDDDVAPMTWDQARDLLKRGFSIGAHGATHAIMTRETKADAFANIARSIARVSAETGERCTSFAFPNGNYTAELAQHAVRCGARFVMTTEPTWADRRFPLWRLPRVQLFGSQGRRRIEFKIAVSATGSILPSGDGTGTIYREINRIARESPLETRGRAAEATPGYFGL